MDQLRQAPYNLKSGDPIIVRASAFNLLGEGDITIYQNPNVYVLGTPPNIDQAPYLDFKTNSLITFSWDNILGQNGYTDGNLFEVYWANGDLSGH